MYNAVTRKVQRQFTRFKDKAYCGNFRADNKLLVAGGEDGTVQVCTALSTYLHYAALSIMHANLAHAACTPCCAHHCVCHISHNDELLAQQDPDGPTKQSITTST